MSDWQGFQSHVSHLECSATGERYEAAQPHNLSRAGKPLIVRYDLKSVGRAVDRAALAKRPADLWRYRELLPLRRPEDVVNLGELFTPLVPLAGTSRRMGGGELLVKDEGRLPTGSFKARGLAVAVSMAKSFGACQIAMPTVGSGGASLAAYCRRAGIEAIVFCPEDSPAITVSEIAFYGAKVYLANGTLKDCNRLVAEGCAKMGWFDMSTLKEPYRIEGKKTMASNSLTSSAGSCPTLFSTRPVAALASSACGRRSQSWKRLAGSGPSGRAWWPFRRAAAVPSSGPLRRASARSRRRGPTSAQTCTAFASPRRSVTSSSYKRCMKAAASAWRSPTRMLRQLVQRSPAMTARFSHRRGQPA